jgi:hypothetical protein
MFFVPLIGAVVTGRHYNVKGWQNAVVYLAGPVPGIIAALVLMAVPAYRDQELIQKIALVSLVINGVNLLPVFPLDGGGIVNAILFSRHFVLETVFVGCAGAALIAASIMGYGRFWVYLGILALIGLPASYRASSAAARLKKSGIPTTSPDSQTIPPGTALTIIGELRRTPPTSRSVKLLAKETLTVFQKLNATPPGAAASAWLLAVYLGSGVGAFLGAKDMTEHRRCFFLHRSSATPQRLRLADRSEQARNFFSAHETFN